MMVVHSVERVYAALDLKEPDMVPIDESLWRGVEERILKDRKFDAETDRTIFLRKRLLDLDVVKCSSYSYHPSPEMNIVTEKTAERTVFRDGWGTVWADYAEGRCALVDVPIKTREDWDSFEFPRSAVEALYDTIKRNTSTLKEHFFVYGTCCDPFETAVRLRGHTELLKDVHRSPAFARRVFEESTKYNINVGKLQAELGVHGIRIYGDVAAVDGPMMSPKNYHDLIIPYLKEMVSSFKKMGLPVRFHSDGDIRPLIPDLISTGIDALDPLEPKANMDLKFMKENYGHRICLIGNIDNRTTLPNGTPEDVEKEVKEKIRIAAPDGGYILHSGHSIGTDVPTENIFAMVRAARKNGKYPITPPHGRRFTI